MFAFLGIVLGIIFGHGFGSILLGWLIGTGIDLSRSKIKVKRVVGKASSYSRAYFTRVLLILTAEVMKADGNVSVNELNYVKAYLRKNYSPETANSILQDFREILAQNFNVEDICIELSNNASEQEKLYILQFLFGVASSDRQFTSMELNVIQQFSIMMGIHPTLFESIKSMYVIFGQQQGHGYSSSSSAPSYNIDTDYRILGIPSSSTDAEVKRAFRSLAMKYHPDKVNHLGEDIRKDAEVKFSKLNQAYERIKKARNMK
ncbi:MAG: TerB family tellurite resistance protein [Bacteroidales bacterium]|jgi:DnaJ like chaperone protein|nr:TerB family tellurite resistance protein [Bacteroidales bacterium]